MKNIAFFLQSGVGGAERMAVTIAKMLDKNKYKVRFYLVCLNNVENTIRDFIPEEFEIYEVTPKSTGNLLVSMYHYIKKTKPCIIFGSALYLNDKLLLLRPLFPRIRFVVRCENYLYTYTKLQRCLVFFTYHLADVIIAQTKEMADELTKMGIKKHNVKVLENPLDADFIIHKANETNPFEGIKEVIYVASGRVCYQKGFDMLIKSFSQLVKRQPESLLFILGSFDGCHQSVYKECMTLIDNLNLSKKITFLGYQKNPYPYIKHADCFTLSSRWEGLPNVLIESLFLGTPVASFKCIPIIERIVDQSVGALADRDDIIGLSEAMLSAAKLGRVVTKYKPSTKDDFINLFNAL